MQTLMPVTGRERQPRNETVDASLGVVMTRREKELIRKHAATTGHTMSSWARDVLVRAVRG